MGTRCKIAYQKENKVECITCLNDGAFENIGKKLATIYNTDKYVSMIMNRGDLVVLGTNLRKFDKEKNASGTVDNYQLNKKKIAKKIYNDISDLLVEDTESLYIYYFNNGLWSGMEVYDDKGKLKPYLSEFVDLNSKIA